MKIHHIGYAVKNITNSIIKFEKLGYKKVGTETIDKERNISIQFIKNEYCVVELISPLNEESPVCNLLKKHGNSPYHICYETEDIQEEIENLKRDGYILIESPKKALAIDNRKVVFLFNKHIGIIELVEVSK